MPLGVWIIAGTELTSPYPCRCTGKRCSYICPCRGRTDLAHLPRTCCVFRGQR